MKVIILEDNLSYVLDYEMILEKLDVKVEAVHKSWTEALASIKKNPPDFMIVDLLLDNNEKGLDFIHEVRGLFIPIIICTGYPETEFMDQALENEVVAFFGKPLDKPALKFCIKKLLQSLKDKRDSNKFLVVKDRGTIIKVPFDRIIKIEIEGNYSFVFTNTGKKFILKLSLKKLSEKLDGNLFQRCHRSTVVNVDAIKSFDIKNSRILLVNDDWIDLGSKFKNEIKQTFLSRNN